MLLADSRARGSWSARASSPTRPTAALAATDSVTHVVVAGAARPAVPPGVTLLTWDDALDRGQDAATVAAVATGEDASALWLYTSGTTGKPKAAMHRHANIRHVCET